MQKKLNNKGFTIVEVLIVLAIAGAILAAVLIAVPALQRSGRNATAKTTAQNVVSGIADNIQANGGTIPTAMSTASGVLTFTNAGSVVTKVNVSPSITITSAAAATIQKPGNILVVTSAICASATGTTTSMVTTGTSNANSFAVLYPIETGSGTDTNGCVQA